MGDSLSSLTLLIGNGMGSTFGDPLILGVLVLAFFGCFVFLQGQRFDGLILIGIPAIFLALGIMNNMVAVTLFVIGAGIILYLAYKKLFK